MAAGGITTLPALPEDGGAAFPPGHFKDPKRLYCKNGGFFLRIHPDGRVDGVREKSDPHDVPISCYEDTILMSAEDKYAFTSSGHGTSPSPSQYSIPPAR
ncbi:Fibroblast growth factor 2 [Microtus ochrogaster]|uniref:Fibroblast growth factor 2 n=1 Tax=Microtus ochrogaster TaxID=79684 RepID=A0A8J6G8G6_MICOH|nr:Fibroblast growth factor 2 [Microtus ochrogaster]